jgi:hypothetical protein
MIIKLIIMGKLLINNDINLLKEKENLQVLQSSEQSQRAVVHAPPAAGAMRQDTTRSIGGAG